MLRVHIHTPGWVHRRGFDRHAAWVGIDHLVHNRRFWAALVLGLLLAAIVTVAVLTKFADRTPVMPIYPTFPSTWRAGML